MPLVHRDIPGLYNGVSQQAPPLRLPNQVEAQVNFLSSITSGVEKRPGTKHIVNLTGSKVNDKTLSYAFRDSEGRDYLFLFTGDATEPLEIYLLDGTKCSILGDIIYLTGNTTSDPRNDYRVCAIADYAMVVNRNVYPEMTEDASPAFTGVDKFALLWVKKGVVSTTYKIGNTSYTTPNSNVAETTDISTEEIATQLAATFDADNPNFFVSLVMGSVIRIGGYTGADWSSLGASDTYGDTALKLLKGKARKIEDLPPRADDGDVIEITKDTEGMSNGYYMRYSKADGIWSECVAPGSKIRFRASDMPHQLIRTGVTTFLLRSAVEDTVNGYPGWQDRLAGDEFSAPLPSFLGHSVRDIFYHKNRLCFLSGQNIIASKPNDYFNFFPDTVSTTLDTDPLDRAVGFNEPVILEWAVPFKEDLLLFSGNRQFLMSSGMEVFTAQKAMIDPVTNFPCSVKVRPINLGSSLVFPSDNGNFSLVREYFIQADTLQNDAADITAHCPRYIPKGISRAVHLANSGTVLMLGNEDRSALWVYRYYWSGSEKPQSAWSKFEFSFDILALEVFDEIVYLVIKQGNEIRMSSFDVASTSLWLFDEAFLCDEPVYDSTTNTTTLPFPYTTSNPVTLIWETTNGAVYQGFTVVTEAADHLVVSGDLTEGTVYMGQPFESLLTLSELFISPDGKVGTLQGRLQIKSITLSFMNTGNFHLEVAYPGRGTMIHNYTGAVLGDALLSTEALRSERKRFMVRGDARNLSVSIKNDGVLPSTFDSLSFEGMYYARTQRTP